MNSIVETLTFQTLIVSSPQLNCSTQEIVRELWLLVLPALVIRGDVDTSACHQAVKARRLGKLPNPNGVLRHVARVSFNP
jgi:hypothetical protein